MNKVAVNTSVPVIEGMNIDEAEREYCGGNDGIELLRWFTSEGNHAFCERW